MRRNFVWLIWFSHDGLRVLYATLILSAVGLTALAGVGQWKSYTDMTGVTGIARTEDDVWVATHGGLFRLHLSDSSFTTYTNSEGLTDNDLTAVLVDDLGNVWVGTSSGAIDVFDPGNETWQHISDIVFSGKTRKGITGFYQFGDSVFIASDFGV